MDRPTPEEEAMTKIDRERMRIAVALSLINDGYIDIDAHDGEAYIYGDPNPVRPHDVEGTADSIIEWYEADQEAAVAKVLTIRAREGRE